MRFTPRLDDVDLGSSSYGLLTVAEMTLSVMADFHKAARQQWSALKGVGAALSYWKQSPEGRWEKQA